jgi:cation:H+ antiporter
MNLLMTIGGALILMIAGDMLVRGAIAISLKSGLSATLISLTVVALGTSAPEMVISIEAALYGSPDIAIGNVVGSNIANVLLIVGVPAIILAMNVEGTEMRRNFALMLLATVLFCAFAMTGGIGRIAGAVMLAALAAMIFYSYRQADRTTVPDELDGADGHAPMWKVAAWLAVGVVGLPLGANLLIEGARGIALTFGLSEAAIGLTIVALGTSLPELAASTAAAFRGRADVALGNVIGSNMLNLLAVVAVTAVIAPLDVAAGFRSVDIPIMVVVTLLLAPFLIWHVKLGRRAGSAFLALYVAYAIFALGNAAA